MVGRRTSVNPWEEDRFEPGERRGVASLPVMNQHQSHPKIVKRLKRAQGHLRSVIEMIEQEKPCLDIAQQLHAVERAVAQAKRTLIHDHLDNCLEETVGPLPREKRGSVDDFKEIAKYL